MEPMVSNAKDVQELGQNGLFNTLKLKVSQPKINIHIKELMDNARKHQLNQPSQYQTII